MTSKPAIAFAGVSHLSLVYAVAFSSFASTTIVYDHDVDKVNSLKTGVLPVDEPHLRDGLLGLEKTMEFTADINQLSKADIVFIAKDILTDSQNNSIDGCFALKKV